MKKLWHRLNLDDYPLNCDSVQLALGEDDVRVMLGGCHKLKRYRLDVHRPDRAQTLMLGLDCKPHDKASIGLETAGD